MPTEAKVLFQDAWVLAMDKPSGLTVHEGTGIRGGRCSRSCGRHLILTCLF